MNFQVDKNWSLQLIFTILQAFICYQCISAEGRPRKLAIADDKRITFTHVDEPLELTCPIEMSDTLSFVDWSRGNKSLYMEPGYVITNKGTLKIRRVTKEHAGVYTCEGVNGYAAVPVNITVIVDNPEVENGNLTAVNPNSAHRVNVFPPSIKKRSSTNFVDEVGGQATFHCVATGQPKPHVFWFKNGHLMQGTELLISKGKIHSTLKLRRLEKEDAGVYKCIARNKMGEDEIDYTLLVTDVPKPPKIVSLEPPDVTINEGEPAVFWCEVNSKPGLKLHIKWLKKLNKEEIVNSENKNNGPLFRTGTEVYRPLNLTDGASTDTGVYKSKLLIRNSCAEDSGTYVCLALNDKGFNSKNVTLTVIKKVTKSPSRNSYFSTNSNFVIFVSVALVAVLGAFLLVAHLYCRGKSQKNVVLGRQPINGECDNLKPNSTPMKKNVKTLPYPDVNDPQSKSKLLRSDSTCAYETENQICKSVHVKTYNH